MDAQTQYMIDSLSHKEPLIRILTHALHTNLIIVNNGTEKNPDYIIKGMDLVIKQMELAIDKKNEKNK